MRPWGPGGRASLYPGLDMMTDMALGELMVVHGTAGEYSEGKEQETR